MVVIVLLQIDLDPVHLAAELVAVGAVVRRHRRAAFLADVAGLVGGEDHRHGLLDAALRRPVLPSTYSVTLPPLARPPPSYSNSMRTW